MAYPISIKKHAISLRKKGYSIKEIAKIIGITQSTASLWLRGIFLNQKAQKRLKQRRILGQYKASLVWVKKRQIILKRAQDLADDFISKLPQTPEISKLICALLYWAEGAKSGNVLKFVNSDPKMIKTFLFHFRNAFKINESKFRVLVHIHEYHNDNKIKQFWSKNTQIPLSQFNKSYLKPHTGHRKKPDYKGCIAIHYGDVVIVREIQALYNRLATTT